MRTRPCFLFLAFALILAAACGDRHPVAPERLVPATDSVRICGSEDQSDCQLEPISGTIDPKKPTDEGGDHNPGTDPPPGGDPGGGGGGGGSGGTEPPPGDTTVTDTTCNTGDPVIDTQAVQEAFDSLWARSNVDANLAQRRERGGWIVSTSTGYAVVPFVSLETSFCRMKGDEDFPTSGAVVGFVHTHPYSVGELIVNCEFQFWEYKGRPSSMDIKMGLALGSQLGWGGALPGYILDTSGIRAFAKDQPSRSYDRCGY